MSDGMSGARFVVDQNPTIRVLDTDYNHRIIREWDRGTRRLQVGYAQTLANQLNEREALEFVTLEVS